MNAGLQCLSHIEPFASYFLSGKYKEEVNSSNALGCKGQLAKAFADLQHLLWQSNKNSQDPRVLHRKLTRFAPHLFDTGDQQDVQEFLAFCLDGLHEDLNRVQKRPPPITEEDEKHDEELGEEQGEEFAAALAWMRHLEYGKSFLIDLLQGQLRSTLTCTVCGHKSRRFDPFLYLSVPVNRNMSTLTEPLDKYIEEELLTGDEQWYCEKCKCKVDAGKKIDIWKFPPVLVLHLKRFEFHSRTCSYKKTDCLLTSDLHLDLMPYAASHQREGALYSIVCIANHSGKYGSGHYTATCKVNCGEHSTWHVFNDERVSELRESSPVVGREAYVLFLVRCRDDDSPCGSTLNSLKKQTVSMPELWPHWVSTKNSKVGDLLQNVRRPLGACSPAAQSAPAAFNVQAGGSCAAATGTTGNSLKGCLCPCLRRLRAR